MHGIFWHVTAHKRNGQGYDGCRSGCQTHVAITGIVKEAHLLMRCCKGEVPLRQCSIAPCRLGLQQSAACCRSLLSQRTLCLSLTPHCLRTPSRVACTEHVPAFEEVLQCGLIRSKCFKQ